MNKRIKGTLRQSFYVGYSDMLKRVRKCSKGLRSGFFFCILLVGDNPTAPTLTHLANLGGLKVDNTYNRLMRAIRAGYVYKDNKRYYLTSSGRLAYEAMCREYDATMNEILRELLKEAQKRVK